MGLGPLQAGGGAGGRPGVPVGPGELLLLEEAGAPREQLWGLPRWEGEETVYSMEGTELWSPQGEARADSGSTSVLETRPSSMAVFAGTRVCVCVCVCVCLTVLTLYLGLRSHSELPGKHPRSEMNPPRPP